MMATNLAEFEYDLERGFPEVKYYILTEQMTAEHCLAARLFRVR